MTDANDLFLQYLAGATPATEKAPPEAKPTTYKDVTFRSALEACWAETLDKLGVVWEYEPEMIALPSGANYLPDFRLPEIAAWLEVKGHNVPRVEKAQELGRTLACECSPAYACSCRWRGGWIVILGHPPRILRREGDHRRSWWMNWSSVYGSNPWFTTCPNCTKAGWTTGPECRACEQPLTGNLIAAADTQIRMAGR